MTNQEAIEELKEVCCGECDGWANCPCPEECDSYNAVAKAINALEEQDKHRWIPVSEKMPEEYDSIFAKWKGTDKWNNAMFEKRSDDVIVTFEFEGGIRGTMSMHTVDGKWKYNGIVHKNVIAWMPLPEPYKESEEK